MFNVQCPKQLFDEKWGVKNKVWLDQHIRLYDIESGSLFAL